MTPPLDPNELETPQHQTSVTLPLCEETKVRFSQTARQLEEAKVQGYVEANFALKLLDLVKEILSMAPFIS